MASLRVRPSTGVGMDTRTGQRNVPPNNPYNVDLIPENFDFLDTSLGDRDTRNDQRIANAAAQSYNYQVKKDQSSPDFTQKWAESERMYNYNENMAQLQGDYNLDGIRTQSNAQKDIARFQSDAQRDAAKYQADSSVNVAEIGARSNLDTARIQANSNIDVARLQGETARRNAMLQSLGSLITDPGYKYNYW